MKNNNKNVNMLINDRNSNIELLRLILIFMVVIEHFTGSTYSYDVIKNNITTNFIFHLLSSLSVAAVNCFMIISGFFLFGNKKIKISKIVDLLVIVVFYRYLNYFCNLILLKENFSVKELIIVSLPINYFAIFYCIVYFFSPFISKLYEIMNRRQSSFFTVGIILIFLCIPTILDFGTDLTGIESNVLSPISLLGNGGGYTIVQFFVDLCLGMYIKKINFNVSSKILFIVYFISSLLISVFIERFNSLWNYCCIFTVINAICLFLIFNKLTIKNKWINYLSKSVFAIFCIHTGRCASTLWTNFFISEEYFFNSLIFNLIWMFFGVFTMFVICLLISILMRLLFTKIKSCVFTHLPVVELF